MDHVTGHVTENLSSRDIGRHMSPKRDRKRGKA